MALFRVTFFVALTQRGSFITFTPVTVMGLVSSLLASLISTNFFFFLARHIVQYDLMDRKWLVIDHRHLQYQCKTLNP